MHPSSKLQIPALAAALTMAACGSSSYSGSSSNSPGTASSAGGGGAAIRTTRIPSLGATVLVDANGMTLYSLSAERNGRFICTNAACLQLWHPLSAAAGAPSGTVASLGTVARPDGSRQVTYKGMPLYTFAQDRKPGESGGQGFKDVGTWAAVTVTAKTSAGAPSSAPAQTAPPSSTGGSSGGYHY